MLPHSLICLEKICGQGATYGGATRTEGFGAEMSMRSLTCTAVGKKQFQQKESNTILDSDNRELLKLND